MEFKDFRYIRIEGQEYAENTMHPMGIFAIFRKMIMDHTMEQEDEDLFREIDLWIAEVLPYPDVCRNREKVICFFKTENSDEMMKMIHPALWLLERYKKTYYLVLTNDPGESVYEDDYQVAVRLPEKPEIVKMPEDWGVSGLSK